MLLRWLKVLAEINSVIATTRPSLVKKSIHEEKWLNAQAHESWMNQLSWLILTISRGTCLTANMSHPIERRLAVTISRPGQIHQRALPMSETPISEILNSLYSEAASMNTERLKISPFMFPQRRDWAGVVDIVLSKVP